MKKISLNKSLLNLSKEKISNLNAYKLTGGLVESNLCTCCCTCDNASMASPDGEVAYFDNNDTLAIQFYDKIELEKFNEETPFRVARF